MAGLKRKGSTTDLPETYDASDRSCPLITSLFLRDNSFPVVGISMENFCNRFLYAEDFEYLDRIMWNSTRGPQHQVDRKREPAPSNARHERLKAYLRFHVRHPIHKVPQTPDRVKRGFSLQARLRFAMLFIVIAYACFAIAYGVYEQWIVPRFFQTTTTSSLASNC